MRIWFIPYGYLDAKRLLSQHQEVHGLTNCILNGRKWGSVTERFKRSVPFLQEVHESVVLEMKNRNPKKRKHLSPFVDLEEIPQLYCAAAFVPTEADFIKDIQQLRAKWEAEGYYFGVGRLDLREMEERYGLPLGKTQKEAAEVRAETKKFYLANKETIKGMGDLRLGQKLQKLRNEASAPTDQGST